MQRDLVVKGRGLGGAFDLTLLAKIKPGFIDSLESVNHKTRIKRVLETLHGARLASHEHATAQLLSDAVERVGVIQSVRVAVLEPEDKVLLAVTFDGSWESYIRVLWDKVGTLLDLIFCGTEDYTTAYGNSFEAWLEWARRVQVETGFFYGPPASTARDAFYHRRTEQMRVRGHGAGTENAELDELRTTLPSAEAMVERMTNNVREPVADDPPYPRVDDVRMVRERVRNGLQGLAALYRLIDLHPPLSPEGEILRRASLDLLREFVAMRDAHLITDQLEKANSRFARQLAWLFPKPIPAKVVRGDVPGLAANAELPLAALSDLQGGIVRTYDNLTHGVVLMLAFPGPAAARDALHWLEARLTRADHDHDASGGQVLSNIAFTLAGLRAVGLGEDALDRFPEEFRQGMAARAGSLGDVRNNHPRRWRLPRRFVAIDAPAGPETIELDTVHAVLQLRCGVAESAKAALAALELADRHHPLRSAIEAFRKANRSVQILAVQTMTRNYIRSAGQPPTIVEHFGYSDGDSQPELKLENESARTPAFDFNRIHAGEILVGHANAADPAFELSDPALTDDEKAHMRLVANGSFLVIRKYRQFVDRLEKRVVKALKDAAALGTDRPSKEQIYAKLMGRSRDGASLVPGAPGSLNNFLYKDDPQGDRCPLGSHIRRANPRLPGGTIARPPRLIRRGMSYGPSVTPARRKAERGLVFMAYNASIGEQFEVVQRWLAGGNATGISSGQGCPIVGVPENGVARRFRFAHADHVVRVSLEAQPRLFDDPEVVAQLEWGLYTFAPSISGLRALRAAASAAIAASPATAVPWRLQRGRDLIFARRQADNVDEVTAIDGWKVLLEDPESIDRLDAAAVWAAIREDHGGVLRTPYGVLVASGKLVCEVFRDPQERYSVSGQLDRMKKSFGEISLGMDAGPEYDRQSMLINKAIGKLTKKGTFDIAFTAARDKIDAIVREAKEQANEANDERYEVGFDVREVADEVLIALCNAWFGLADDPHGRFARGGADWAWKPGAPPPYPGHFTALSRYMFQPNPGPTAVNLGQEYGRGLHYAMRLFVADHRASGTLPMAGAAKTPGRHAAPIAKAVFDHPELGGDDEYVARNMVGVLMGFNPTIIGAILNIVRELQREGRFGALRAQLAGRVDFATAHALLDDAMAGAASMRPMPQIGWRTARKAHRLGCDDESAIDIAIGDRLVLGIVSGTQQSLADGEADCRLMFGGIRSEPGHPTHACPGYEAAIGALLGTLSALMTRPENMRPGSAPLTFLMDGGSGFRRPATTPATKSPPPQLPKRSGLVLAWGDSWLDFSHPTFGELGRDLRDWLDRFGYSIARDFCAWTTWPKAETMAAAPEAFCAFIREQLQTQSERPLAIVLSAGGNDSTQTTLEGLINKKAPGVAVLNQPKLDQHIAKLKAYYETILRAIDAETTGKAAASIPVLIHGYDHPFPQGKGPWLRPPFEHREYGSADIGAMTTAMRDLIDALNAMLLGLAQDAAFSSWVEYVDLRGTIAQNFPADAKIGWANDLHPTEEGFLCLAKKLDDRLQKICTAAAAVPSPAMGATTPASTRTTPGRARETNVAGPRITTRA